MLLDDFGYREVALVILVCASMELGAVGVLMIQGWSAWGPSSADGCGDVEAALCGEKKRRSQAGCLRCRAGYQYYYE
jgi:hypothetical protein